jgi:hypothetical protein
MQEGDSAMKIELTIEQEDDIYIARMKDIIEMVENDELGLTKEETKEALKAFEIVRRL